MKPTTLLSLLAAPSTLLSIAAPAAAQPAPAAIVSAEPAVPRNSLSLNPLSLLFGDLSVTYERRLDAHHAIVVDAGAGGTSNDQVDESHAFVGAGWRYHLRGSHRGGFVGAMLHQGYGHGEAIVDDGAASEERHPMTIYSTMITANAGYRWMLGDHWNLTARLGLGWGSHTAVAQEDTPAAKMAEQTTNEALRLLPIGVDGELSLGYAF